MPADSLKAKRPDPSRLWPALRRPLLAVALGLLFGAVVILMAGENVLECYRIMFRGGFGSLYYFTTTLTRATPIIFCGLSVAVAWRSGIPSIGAEGQMICAGLSAAMVATLCPGSPLVRILAAFIAGCLAGALYSVLAAWLFRQFNADLIITTLMLNYIAHYVTYYLVEYKFKDTAASDIAAVQTAQLDPSLRLPVLIQSYSVHLGFVIALVLTAVLYWVLRYTVYGYQSRISGLNEQFAIYGGISSLKMLYSTMALSGAIAGLAAVCEVLGTKYRYVNDMFRSPGYAWVGIMVALLANNNPLGIVISSVFIAGITIGSQAVARSTAVPVEVSSMIQGIITLFLSAQLVSGHIRKRRKDRTLPGVPEPSAGEVSQDPEDDAPQAFSGKEETSL